MGKKATEQTGWVEAVARRAAISPEVTEKILEELEIRPSGHLPRPHTLLLTGIRFSGVKQTDTGESSFAFDWSLSPGLHCLASERNLVGKSSTLRTILWALKGQVGALQADVRKWLHEVKLSFMLDSVEHHVEFKVTDGQPQGKIIRAAGAKNKPIAHFDGASDFARTMDGFMLDALGLDHIPAWQSFPGAEDGKVVPHGWAAYTGALVIAEAAHKVLLGETEQAGLPGRLLQMFVGLPWAPTMVVARAKEQELSQRQRNEARRRDEDDKARREEEGQLKTKLDQARQALGLLPDDKEFAASLATSLSNVAAAHTSVLVLRSALFQLNEAAQLTRKRRLEDQARLLDAEETRLAQRFFSGLDPSCCPRCDSAIGQERRKREKEEETCAVCASPLQLTEYDEATMDALKGAAKASEDAEKQVKSQLETTKSKLTSAEASLSEVQTHYEALQKKGAEYADRRKLELDIARLEGALAERQRTRVAVDNGKTAPAAHERLAVAKAAAQEADERAKAATDEIFTELNEEVLQLAQSFGMDALSSARLDRAARLAVTKGGQKTWFSYLTPGERLRLRVATIVGMLRVAERRGVGRHPGVLILDSPGAEESNRNDAAELLRELARLSSEMQHLQVLITTARPELVRGVLPDSRVRLVPRGQHLW